MTKHSLAAACTLTLASLALASTGFAGTAAPAKSCKQMKETIKESCITGDIGIDITSMYIARGISLENQGAILQPYIDLSFRIYEGDGALTKVSLDLGFWNSFHSRHTGSGGFFGGGGSTTNAWFESDFTAGLSFVFNKNLTLSPYYRAYMSPNDAFETAQDIGLRIAYDDTDLLGAWALHPYALVQFDVENSSGNGTDEGIYYEVGIAPGMQVGPVMLSLPIKAGFGSSNYYADNANFGFLSAGVNAEYKLAFIPECLGDWSAHANATYYRLGNGTDIAGVSAIRDRDENEVVFGGGLRIAF
ncbi:MAG: hypothetical protein K8R23_07135 [Chthoniobacter sp.]|nr:hypothetical protein [Chthoniobacter sp.]